MPCGRCSSAARSSSRLNWMAWEVSSSSRTTSSGCMSRPRRVEARIRRRRGGAQRADQQALGVARQLRLGALRCAPAASRPCLRRIRGKNAAPGPARRSAPAAPADRRRWRCCAAGRAPAASGRVGRRRGSALPAGAHAGPAREQGMPCSRPGSPPGLQGAVGQQIQAVDAEQGCGAASRCRKGVTQHSPAHAPGLHERLQAVRFLGGANPTDAAGARPAARSAPSAI